MQTVTSLESLSWNHCRSPFLHSTALNLLSSSIMAQKALIFAQPSHRMSFFCPSTYRAVAASAPAAPSALTGYGYAFERFKFHIGTASPSLLIELSPRVFAQSHSAWRENGRIDSNRSYPASTRTHWIHCHRIPLGISGSFIPLCCGGTCNYAAEPNEITLTRP